MNLPNRLTLARILLVPVFALLAAMSLRNGSSLLYFLAGAVFAAASLTDLLDGAIARKQHLVTNFGKFADPLADKILTTAAFLYMQQEGVCDPAVIILILFREFAVSGLRMLAAGNGTGQVIAANIWGKLKTVTMMLSILFFYFGSAILPAAVPVRPISSVLCWICAVSTLISGITYFASCRDLFKDSM